MPNTNKLCFLSPRNMIGQSQSGTGKTAAFVLTMLTRVEPSVGVPQVQLYCLKYISLFLTIYA